MERARYANDPRLHHSAGESDTGHSEWAIRCTPQNDAGNDVATEDGSSTSLILFTVRPGWRTYLAKDCLLSQSLCESTPTLGAARRDLPASTPGLARDALQLEECAPMHQALSGVLIMHWDENAAVVPLGRLTMHERISICPFPLLYVARCPAMEWSAMNAFSALALCVCGFAS